MGNVAKTTLNVKYYFIDNTKDREAYMLANEKIVRAAPATVGWNIDRVSF